MKQRLSGRFWASLVIFSFIGQVAWVVENMYFNVFVYKMFNASAADISLMVAISAVMAAVTTLLVGAWSDRVGRRKAFICVGYLAWGLTILSFALIRAEVIAGFAGMLFPAAASVSAIGVTLVIVMDAVMTFFGSSANDAAFNAWVTDISDETNRGAIEGINSMMPLMAVLAVFGGFMFFDLDQPASWVTIFTIIGGAVLIIGLAGIVLIREKPLAATGQHHFADLLYGFRPTVMRRNPILYTTLAAFAVFGVSIQIYMPYLIIYYEKSLGLKNYVLIMAPAIVLAAIITAFYGRLYDRFRFRIAITPAILTLMAGYLLLYFSRQTPLVFIGSLLMMTGYLTGMAVFGAMIRDNTPAGKVGLFQGLRIIGQVLIPGVLGPAIGAAVLANADTVLNSDGTRSFIPNADIFLAALLAAVVLWLVLAAVFRLVRQDHQALLTPEGEALEGQPWPDYPRPQLQRDSWLNLNGRWDFARSLSRRLPARYPGQILVPFPPESMLSGVNRLTARLTYLYYRRTFSLPADMAQERVLLHFGAVDQTCVVYLNGERLAGHTGGYLPFTVDLTDHLQAENTLIVQARDPLSHTLPYGKQRRRRGGIWYTPVSGIWQTVWLESVPEDYIRDLRVTPAPAAVTVEFNGPFDGGHISITTPQGTVEQDFRGCAVTVEISDPVSWSPENPYLYRFTLTAGHDRVASYFALRTLDIRDIDGQPRLCLNGRPYYCHGVLDQGYFSDGLYLPADPAGYRRDIMTMKQLGFNTLRKHVKVEPAIYYALCDQLGVLVFQDMPNLGHYSYLRDTVLPTLGFTRRNDRHVWRSAEVKANYEQAMEETIRHLYNHPSIVLWTLFNEGWGQFASDRQYAAARLLDTTRWINSTSGWFHQADSDVHSLHLYFKPIVASPGRRPVVLSEFGGYSLKLPEHAFNKDRAYFYRRFTTLPELQDAIAQLYRTGVAPQLANGLCASIYTQLSDIEDETNGFLTYDRQVCKVEPAVMQDIAALLTTRGSGGDAVPAE